MSVVIFLACLDLEQKSSFVDGHYLNHLHGFIDLVRVSVPDE
jgi:hypothetical protein